MTCRPLLVVVRDVLRPDTTLYAAFCPACHWQSEESENEQVARARLAAHNTREST